MPFGFRCRAELMRIYYGCGVWWFFTIFFLVFFFFQKKIWDLLMHFGDSGWMSSQEPVCSSLRFFLLFLRAYFVPAFCRVSFRTASRKQETTNHSVRDVLSVLCELQMRLECVCECEYCWWLSLSANNRIICDECISERSFARSSWPKNKMQQEHASCMVVAKCCWRWCWWWRIVYYTRWVCVLCSVC